MCVALATFFFFHFLNIGAAQSQEKKGKEQKPPSSRDETVLRVETELVQIDMIVIDQDGKAVRDLGRADFELYEDGKKQEITHFAVGTATAPARWLTTERKPAGTTETATEPAAARTEISAGRYVVLAIDDYHIAAENLLQTKRTLTRFINQQMIPGDQVAIVTTSGSIGMFQQFTNERAVLERAINRLSVQTRNVTSSFDIPRITDYQAELIDRGDSDAIEIAVREVMRLEPGPGQSGGNGGVSGPSGGRNGNNNPNGGISPRERALLQVQTKARMIVAQNANFTRATLGTMESVIRSLQPLPGRKLMVLVSDGFFLGGNSSSQVYDIRRITDAATRSGVVIYSIDARGLVAVTPGGDASDPSMVDPDMAGQRARVELAAVEAKRDGLHALAVDTGGKAFFNNNDLNAGLQRVLDDNEVYYVLAFEPAASRRDGRFHQLEVRIVDRPKLKVRTRKGYLAAPPKIDKLPELTAIKGGREKSAEKIAKEAKALREKEILRGLGSLFPLREIPVELSADFVDFPETGSCAMVNATISINQLDFQSAEGGVNRAKLDLMVILFDEQGKVATSYGDSININLKQSSFETAIKNGLSYQKVLPLKPGFYQARIAIREESSSRIGSATRWLEIPDLGKKQLILSSVLLAPASENTADANAAPAPGGYQMQYTSATRKFRSGQSMDFMIFAYNARLEKTPPDLVVQPQIYSGSKLVFATAPAKMNAASAGDPLRIPYAARIALASFSPGDYELRVVVIDRTTRETASRRVNFSVE